MSVQDRIEISDERKMRPTTQCDPLTQWGFFPIDIFPIGIFIL